VRLRVSVYSLKPGGSAVFGGGRGGPGAQFFSSYMLAPSGSNRTTMLQAKAIRSKHDPGILIFFFFSEG